MTECKNKMAKKEELINYYDAALEAWFNARARVFDVWDCKLAYGRFLKTQMEIFDFTLAQMIINDLDIGDIVKKNSPLSSVNQFMESYKNGQRTTTTTTTLTKQNETPWAEKMSTPTSPQIKYTNKRPCEFVVPAAPCPKKFKKMCTPTPSQIRSKNKRPCELPAAAAASGPPQKIYKSTSPPIKSPSSQSIIGMIEVNQQRVNSLELAATVFENILSKRQIKSSQTK